MVGIGAVALLAVLVVAAVRSQTTGLVASQRDQARHDIAAALADAYARTGSWTGADLGGAWALAQSTGAQLVILNASGGQVATVMPGHEQDHMSGHDTTPAPRTRHRRDRAARARTIGYAPRRRRPRPVPAVGSTALAAATASPAARADQVPVVVDGKTVGTAVIDFPAASQTAAWQVRGAILQVVGFAQLQQWQQDGHQMGMMG